MAWIYCSVRRAHITLQTLWFTTCVQRVIEAPHTQGQYLSNISILHNNKCTFQFDSYDMWWHLDLCFRLTPYLTQQVRNYALQITLLVSDFCILKDLNWISVYLSTKHCFSQECPFWRVSFNVGSTCWQTLRFTTTFALSTSCATWLVQDLCMWFLLLLWPICHRHIDVLIFIPFEIITVTAMNTHWGHVRWGKKGSESKSDVKEMWSYSPL